MSPETLTFALQCIEGATFTVRAVEIEEMAARVTTARRELAEGIAVAAAADLHDPAAAD